MNVFMSTVIIMMAFPPGLQGKVATIQHVYPETEDYRCHCPSIRLNCTFPEGALVASWYVFANGTQENCNGYPQHEVETSSGGLLLVVNNTRQLDQESNIYSCTAVYSDGSTAESNTMVLPPYEDGRNAASHSFTESSPTAYSLNVVWVHDYKLCKHFHVLVDGRHITKLPRGSTSYYINNLQPSTLYNVTVIAEEPGMPNVTVSSIFTTDVGPHFCLTPYGIPICFVPPLGGCLILTFSGVVTAFCLKCKLKKAEKNEVGPKREKFGVGA